MVKRMETIDSQKLMEKELPPLRFVVDRFLPQGFHIFAGPPKIGKSWLLLLLCLKVAKGERFWNYRTEQGRVLYMCLEDSEARIQERLDELTDQGTPNLCFAVDALPLGGGLKEQLEKFLSLNRDTNLVVIDTLQKVRESTNDSNLYASDYKDVGELKTIADQYGIAILAVQHLRKQYDMDPHQMISGSVGLTGAADGSYILKKEKPGDATAKLYIRGRDIEERVLTIRFDRTTKQWQFVSSDNCEADSITGDEILSAVMNYLKREKVFRGTATELSAAIGKEVKGNALARKLTRHENELKEIGIRYSKSRTGDRRELLLTYEPTAVNDDMTIMTVG